MGGAVGRDPVASTMRRLLMRCGPAESSVRPTKRASSFSTRTPNPSKRSTESLGAIAAITWVTWSMTLAKSTARLDRRDAEGGSAALRLGGLGGGDQRLGRHAAVVEAIAAHQPALDQHDVEAELRGAGGGDQARRPAADDADIGCQRVSHLTATSCARANACRARAPAPARQGRASGSRMRHSKMIPRLGTCPRSSSVPSPEPTLE